MSLKRLIWRKLRNVLPVLGEAFTAPSVKQSLIDQEIRALHDDVRSRTPDNPMLHGFKVYSQVDEDGIIEHLVQRVGEISKIFFELGCGDGSENNTHYLALKGWRGVWVDGSEENVKRIASAIPLTSPSLLVERMFITSENIVAAVRRWTQTLGEPDFLSLDIDGNDALVLERILTVINPRILVVEYNGKYPPPLKLSVAYKATHAWRGDDYYGSSLQVFIDALNGQYRLVACGASGANAYFVREDLCGVFTSYDTDELYMRPRHHLINKVSGGLSSLKHLRNIIDSSHR